MTPTLTTLRGLYRAAQSERVRDVIRALATKYGYDPKDL